MPGIGMPGIGMLGIGMPGIRMLGIGMLGIGSRPWSPGESEGRFERRSMSISPELMAPVMIASVRSTSFEGESSLKTALFGSNDGGAVLGAFDGPLLEVSFQCDADACRRVARHVHRGHHQLAAMAQAATGVNRRHQATGCTGLHWAAAGTAAYDCLWARARDLARTHPWLIYEL
jgi:hypothetical protein